MTVSLIVAVSDNGVIGRDGKLPWHLPDDLRRFRALTSERTIEGEHGGNVVMGHGTFKSIGRQLPGRRNIVLSRDVTFSAPGVLVRRSLDSALSLCDGNAFVIGGAEVYRLAMPRCTRAYVTRVHTIVTGENLVRMPLLDPSQWREVSGSSAHHPADERHAYAFDTVTLERVRM